MKNRVTHEFPWVDAPISIPNPIANMNRTNRPSLVRTLALLLILPLAACSDSTSPDESAVEAVAGTYTLTALNFDPQGVLPDQDILAALGVNNAQLILTLNRSAQVVYRDPISQLFVTIPGSFQTTAEGVRLQWDANSAYRDFLLSQRMDFVFNAGTGTLTFDANAPDGVSRARLQTLIPEFQEEQLLDPTPGRLRITFTQS
jgi:hypothetical protein